MRQKHSSKKHRIVSLAAEKIANEIVSDKFLEDGFQKQNDPEADQTLRAKQYEYFNPQDVQITQKEEKKSFKQCKIRHLIDSRNLSPTHSDIDYIDTMENYKTYLNKNQSLQAAAKTIKTLKPKRSQHQIVKENTKSKKTDENPKLLKQRLQKEFTMIQEKIEKAKQFRLRSSSDKHFQDIYDEINKARLAQKGIKQNENFCLMSVNQYLKLTSALQSAMLNINGSGLCKTICHKAIRRPLSLEAKRWYHSKPYKTQRQIDPEGLVKAITLEKWNEKKLAFHKAHNSRQKTLKNKSFELNASQFTQNIKQTQETISIRNKRPATAPNGKLKQKCKTEECPLTSSSHFNIENRTKISPSNFDIKNIIPLRRKVKGVKHVERQKWDYKQFRKQSQELFKSSKTQVVSDQIFQYPWNWIKFQNTSKIHARQWKT